MRRRLPVQRERLSSLPTGTPCPQAAQPECEEPRPVEVTCDPGLRHGWRAASSRSSLSLCRQLCVSCPETAHKLLAGLSAGRPCGWTSGSLVLLLPPLLSVSHPQACISAPLGSHTPLSCMHAGFCPRLCSRETQPEASLQHFSICFFRQPRVQRDHLTCSRSTQMAELGFIHILFTA